MVIWLRLLRCLLFGIGPMVFTGGWAADPAPQPLPRLETGMHTAPIKRIATDAAGRWAVTASEDKTARVWDVASGRQVAVLRPPQDVGNEGKLYAVALSPDGTVAAVGGWTKLGSETGNTIYFFDRATGRLLRRLPGLPNVINHLAISPDGRWLGVSLGMNGVRLFDAMSGVETGRDAEYDASSYSAHFSPDGRRLLTTSVDGEVRLYSVEEGKLGPLKRGRPGGGKHAYTARFSPDGRFIALGFAQSTVVQVLDADTLAEVARPATTGVDNGDLGLVAWSADGRYLLAGGSWELGGKFPVRRWPVGEWSHYEELPLASLPLTDLVPLPGGGLLFAAADPAWGIVDPAFQVQHRRDGERADRQRRSPDPLLLSADARRVRFSYRWSSLDPRSFDLVGRSLGADAPELTAARTTAPGLDIRNWKNRRNPSLNGEPLGLKPYEISLSLAIAPDGQRFVLGAEWTLQLFDRSGKDLWPQPRPVPGSVWAVNWSADGRFVVAGYDEGTIRWHRPSDGVEVLALFPHADQKRWIAWTPEGFYATSGPDAEELMGYHLNRGKDREGEFISARQLREHFYQPGLISRRLDADGDKLMAEAVKKLGDVQQLLAGAKAPPPLVELLTGLEVTGEEEVTITVQVKDQGGGVSGLVFYVDGQPQTGRQAGLFADGTESRTFAASPGARRIEVAALNRAGVEGARQVVMAILTGPARDAALHVLAVGVERYQAPGLELKHSAADAQAVANEIAIRAKPLFKRGVFTPMVLKDSDASLAGIEGAFNKLKARMKPQDTLVIFLAGHGEAPIGKGYTFLPWDFKRGAPGDAGEGLSEARLRKLLAQSPTQTLVLLDTCDAGGAAEMIEAAYERLNGVSKHVVIGASRRAQFAKEGFEGHGVFTAALLRVMKLKKPDDVKDRTLRVPAIRVYVEQEVGNIELEMGSSAQQKVSGFLGSANFPLIMQ